MRHQKAYKGRGAADSRRAERNTVIRPTERQEVREDIRRVWFEEEEQ
jgi:hypothetical protein